MSAPIVVYCDRCQKFSRPSFNRISGRGAKIKIQGTGQFRTNCVFCGKMASSPAGEFDVHGNIISRIRSDLSIEQAEELKTKLSALIKKGVSVDELKQLVEGYAPEFVRFIEGPRNNKSTLYWAIFLAFFLLKLVDISINVNINVDLDINDLCDQVINEVNNKIESDISK